MEKVNMALRAFQGKDDDDLIEVFTFREYLIGGLDYEVHMFFSFKDMYNYHEKYFPRNDKWNSDYRREKVEYIKRLIEQGFVHIHDINE